MNAEELAAIKARVEATPRGPWHVEYFGNKGYPQRVGNQAAVLVAETFEGGTGLRPIPEFIAHAREDVPALAAEVERLKAEATVQANAMGELLDASDAVQGLLELCDRADANSMPVITTRRIREFLKAAMDGGETP